MNGKLISAIIDDRSKTPSQLTQVLKRFTSTDNLLHAVYLSTYSRYPTEAEMEVLRQELRYDQQTWPAADPVGDSEFRSSLYSWSKPHLIHIHPAATIFTDIELKIQRSEPDITMKN